MRTYLTLFILFYFINVNADSWTPKASYLGLGWDGSFSFSIGYKGFVGGGIDLWHNYYRDFWEFDPSANVWTQKSDFAGAGRVDGCAFSIGNNGYFGLGVDSSSNLYQDFWEYDPSTNMWMQKTNFGGGNLSDAVGFSIGSFGYIVTGLFNNNIWQYDPAFDTWTQKSVFPGGGRELATSFVIGNSGYVMGGLTAGPLGVIFLNDLWEYNSLTDSWTQRANLPAFGRCDAAAFSICDKGYIGCGEDSVPADFLNDLWQYNPATNSWTQKMNFPGAKRDELIGLSISNKGYMGLGSSYTPNYNDFYEYTPDSACTTGIDELTISNFSIYPNPAKAFAVISWDNRMEKKNVEIKVFDTKGKIVFTKQYQITTSNIKLPTANLPTGIYFVQVSDAENKVVRKMVVE